jgi:phosphate transport system substrate-binding protein
MRTVFVLRAALLTAALACKPVAGPIDTGGGAGALDPSAGGTIGLQGAGATFPYPLYSKWVAEYQRVDSRVRINYQSIGSGGGIRQITERTVDFGASDAPMTDAELARAPGKLLHVPTALGAVVVTFNLPGVSSLKLTPELLAAIFLGDIKTWNDPRLADANPGVALPNQPITVAHRSDGSGTTAVFTDYLSKTSPSWKEKVGAGKSVKFPVGLGAKGNEGVAGQVKTTPGSVGYVELAYARQTGLPAMSIRNRSGQFVEPSLEGITAAAAGVASSMPEDLRLSIVDAPGEASYPISAFTYVLVYDQQSDPAKGKALLQFLWWAAHDGQKFGPPLHYAPLPAPVVRAVEAKLRSVRAAGQPVLGS